MGLDVVQARTLADRCGGKRADLYYDQVIRLLWSDVHVAPAKSHEIRQTGMRADCNPVSDRSSDRLAHGARIARMKTACDIGRTDQGQDIDVLAHGPRAETFAHVAIQINGQRAHSR